MAFDPRYFGEGFDFSTTTVAEALKDLIEDNWAEIAPVAAANIHFDVGWVDRQWIGFSDPSPQIIVSGPMTGPIRFFGQETTAHLGHHMLSHGIFYVNIWVRIPAGADGDAEEDIVERLRREVVRIFNEYSCSVLDPAAVTYVKPLDRGQALHELDRTPRILRFEITVFANYQS